MCGSSFALVYRVCKALLNTRYFNVKVIISPSEDIFMWVKYIHDYIGGPYCLLVWTANYLALLRKSAQILSPSKCSATAAPYSVLTAIKGRIALRELHIRKVLPISFFFCDSRFSSFLAPASEASTTMNGREALLQWCKQQVASILPSKEVIDFRYVGEGIVLKGYCCLYIFLSVQFFVERWECFVCSCGIYLAQIKHKH